MRLNIKSGSRTIRICVFSFFLFILSNIFILSLCNISCINDTLLNTHANQEENFEANKKMNGNRSDKKTYGLRQIERLNGRCFLFFKLKLLISVI